MRVSEIVDQHWNGELREFFELSLFRPHSVAHPRFTDPRMTEFYNAWDEARTRRQKKV